MRVVPIRILLAVLGGLSHGQPLNITCHDGIAFHGLLIGLDNFFIIQGIKIISANLPLAEDTHDFLTNIVQVLVRIRVVLHIVSCLTIEQIEQGVNLLKCDVVNGELDVRPNHQLLKVLELDVVVLGVLERNDVLLDTLDFVLGILHDDLVVLVLDGARLLNLLVHLPLLTEVELAVLVLLVCFEFDDLRLKQFLFDEHAGQDERIQEVLILPFC